MTSADDDQRKKKPKPGGTADPTAPHIPVTSGNFFAPPPKPRNERVQTWDCLTWLQRGVLHFHSSDLRAQTTLTEAVASHPPLSLSIKRILASCPLPNPVLECRWALCEHQDPTPANADEASRLRQLPIQELQQLLDSISIPVAPEVTEDSNTILTRNGLRPTARIGDTVIAGLVLRHGVSYPLPMHQADAPKPSNAPTGTTQDRASPTSLPVPSPSDADDIVDDSLDDPTGEDLDHVRAFLDAQHPEELYATGATSNPPADPNAASRAKYFRYMTIACTDLIDEAVDQSVMTRGAGTHQRASDIRSSILRDAYADWRASKYPRDPQSVIDSIRLGIRLRQAEDASPPSDPTSSP